jgi:transmembrane sensor
VTLPDGSAFQLGPLSVLRVPVSYGAPDRTVELEGDGYFNVAHDSAHPFAVRTVRTMVRDVGTRFIIRARAGERHTEIAVADGEVAIEPRVVSGGASGAGAPNDSASRLLTAGQAALVDDRGAVTLLPRASVDAAFAWTHGEFVFEHTLVPDVLTELGRWYGTTFVLADKSLDTVRLHTTLRGETLLEALVVLETALDVDTHVRGDTVTLTRHTSDRR